MPTGISKSIIEVSRLRQLVSLQKLLSNFWHLDRAWGSLTARRFLAISHPFSLNRPEMPRLARFFPDAIHEQRRADPMFRAEVRFYDLLDRQLPAGWTVFYDIGWLKRRRNDNALRDGQTDFIVAHVSHGALIIELKGGVIGFDGPRQQWTSTDASGVLHDITNPFYQGREGKYNLRDRLEGLLNLPAEEIRLHHAAAFPGIDGPEEWITSEADPKLIIGRQDLDGLPKRITQILDHAKGDAPFLHGKEILGGLEKLLARTTTLPNPLRSQVDAEHAEIQTLTNSQIDLVRRLQSARRLAIRGGAGSGKTYVAVHRARELARQGFRTLLVCHGQPLAAHLKYLIGSEPNLDALSARELAVRYVPGLSLDDPNADAVFPGKLADAMADAAARPFEAILIDEGQDFSADWFVALESCLADGRHGVFYVFHDTNNQAILPGRGQVPLDLLPFDLDENVRNTQSICRSLLRHYQGDVPISARGPEGRAVDFQVCETTAEMKQRLSQALVRMLMLEHLSAKDIVVLTARDPVTESELPAMGWPNGIRLVTDPALVRGRNVLLASVAGFKGLERPVVLVAELDGYLPEDPRARAALWYVAFSRPRNLLGVYASSAILAEAKPSAGH